MPTVDRGCTGGGGDVVALRRILVDGKGRDRSRPFCVVAGVVSQLDERGRAATGDGASGSDRLQRAQPYHSSPASLSAVLIS